MITLTDDEIAALRTEIHNLVCSAYKMAFETHKNDAYWLRRYETLKALEARLGEEHD